MVGASIGAAAVLVGGGVAYAAINGGEPADAHQVPCLRTASLEADGAGFPVPSGTPQEAGRVCAARWNEAFPGVAKPARLVVCVYPRDEHPTGGESPCLPSAGGQRPTRAGKRASSPSADRS